jgi:hypothetical protein
MALPDVVYAAGNKFSTTLAESINNTDLSFDLTDTSGLNSTGGYLVLDKDNASKREIIYYSSFSSATLTIPSGGRGVAGTSAVSHTPGASVTDVIVADHINANLDSYLTEHNADGTHKAANLINLIYPVGSIYISVVSTNPGTLFGVGTWTAFAAGKTLFGLDSGDTDFDTVEETGGAKTKTILKANLPSYNLTVTDSGHTHNGYGAGATGSGILGAVYTGNSAPLSNQAAQATQSATTGITVASGGSGTAMDVVNPYIVTYMFKRTA